jgi:hypothetical protein
MIVGLRSDVHGFWFQAEKYNHTVFCWIKGGLNNFLFFLLFYIPIAFAYLFSIGVFWTAYEKLREGIASTFNHRLKALIVNSANILVFTSYWSILLLIYVIMSFNERDTGVYFYRLVMFGLSAKGVADLFVWIVIADSHTFVIFSKIHAREKKILSLDLNKALRHEVLQYSTAGLRECASRGHMAEENHSKIIIRLEQKESPNPDSRTALDFYQFIGMIFNFGESDRGEKLEKYQARAEEDRIAQRASLVEMSGNDLKEPFHKTEGSASIAHDDLQKHLSSRIDELEMHIALKDYYLVDRTEESDTSSKVAIWNVRLSLFFGKCLGTEESEATKKLRAIYAVDKSKYQITFEEYEPYYFRKIRLLFGVNDDLYMEEFLTTIKERLTEGGASGAFFFFSKSESFIAKSCKRSELNQLRSMAKDYCDHMNTFPHSYITKVYGVYMLRIYGTPLYFFVMNNLFLTEENEPINEKYDIKGSSVNRNASYPKPGDISICTFCNQKYVVPKKQRGLSRNRSVKSTDEIASTDCSFTVGGHHEPNVVMKDNDLKHKLRLPNRTAQIVRMQLEADAKFLLRMGVMDYSLLLGVSTAEYSVGDADFEDDNEPLDRATNMSSNGKTRLTTLSTAALVSGPNGGKSGKSGKSVEMTSVMCNKKMVVSKVVGPKSYYIGIVDFLQSYDYSKRLERYFKIFVLRKDPVGLSAAEPQFYMERFMDKIDDLLPSDNQNTSFSINTADLDIPVVRSVVNPIASIISSSESSSV